MRRFRRRQLLGLLGAFAAAPHLLAQTKERIRIGYMGSDVLSTSIGRKWMVSALRDIGFAEDQNLTIEWRFAEGQIDRMPELAEGLVKSGVRAIVAPTNLEAEIVRRYTKSIPIMMLYAVEPVRMGFAASLSRPGGNVTGVM